MKSGVISVYTGTASGVINILRFGVSLSLSVIVLKVIVMDTIFSNWLYKSCFVKPYCFYFTNTSINFRFESYLSICSIFLSPYIEASRYTVEPVYLTQVQISLYLLFTHF